MIAAGQVTDHVGFFGDLMPTLAELSGAEPPAKTDGISLVPLPTGETEKQKSHKVLYWEFHERNPSQAVLLDGRWKAIRDVRADKVVLFDVKNDIAEQTDVAEQHPELVKRARDSMARENEPNEHWDIHQIPAKK